MARFVLAVALTVSACAGSTTASTTSRPQTTTTFPAATTTTHPAMEVEVRGCQSPPVTFSPLCEAYELLDTWYVDTPLDTAALVDAAIVGLERHRTTATEEPPRTLFCAVPEEAFAVLCDELATRVVESQIPVGPAVEAALSHMIDTGLDPFTYYVPPEQVGVVRLNGIVGGVGVVLDARDAVGSRCVDITDVCQLEIVIVLEDNPGWDAGLEPGDVVTAVDGEAVAGQGFTAVVSTMAGDETGRVDVTIERDGSVMTIPIERRELVVPTVEASVPVDDVGYIDIPDFEMDIAPLVTAALREMADANTVVVDLRDNPGGLVDVFVEVADEFVDGGVVMVSESAGGSGEYRATPGGTAIGQRVIVLVNQGTASAAEVLAGALRDRRDAIIVGTNTFGKDAVQIPFTLRNGGELYVAVARWSTPEGDTVGNGGLTPDRQVTWPPGGTVEEIVRIALEAAS